MDEWMSLYNVISRGSLIDERIMKTLDLIISTY